MREIDVAIGEIIEELENMDTTDVKAKIDEIVSKADIEKAELDLWIVIANVIKDELIKAITIATGHFIEKVIQLKSKE